MIVFIILYVTANILFCLYEYRNYGASASFIWMLMQLVMFIGISIESDLTISSDRKLLILYGIAFVGFVFGDYLGKINIRLDAPKFAQKTELSKSKLKLLYIICVISIILCFIFFQNTDGNVFIMMIQSFSDGSVDNLSEGRRAINYTSGSGYIYQVRVFILPILTGYVLLFEKKKKWALVMLPLSVIYLLGSGQRAGMMYVLLILFVAFITFRRIVSRDDKLVHKKKANTLFIVLCIIGCMAAFYFLSIANNRTDSSDGFLSAFIYRIFNSNQRSAIYAFRYIDAQPVQYGKDWWNVLKGFIPGVDAEVSLASKIHNIMFGSYKGTSPPCKWGSTYYNFGYVGMIILPIIFGFISRCMYCMLYRRELTYMRITLYCMLFTLLGIWIADSPFFMLVDGLSVVFIFFALFYEKKGGKDKKHDSPKKPVSKYIL